LTPGYLLDTHILIRVLIEPKKLTREQARVITERLRRSDPLSFSAASLLEIAALSAEGKVGLKSSLEQFFADLRSKSVFRLLPITYEIASDVAYLSPVLRDPADCAIVATARVHSLRLITSDQRIIESKLVPVID